MVQLVPGLQSPQDAHGVLGTGLADVHLLKSPLERLVLLDVLAVLVDGRGADAPELPAREGGLEEVGRVHGSGCGAGPDHGVHLR